MVEGDTNRLKKIILIVAISALVLTGIAVLIGTVFEWDNSRNITVENVVYLPNMNEVNSETDTMSYGAAVQYSDGSISSLGYSLERIKNSDKETSDEKIELDGESTRAVPNEGDSWDFSYTGSAQEWEIPANGIYKLEVWGAEGGSTNYAAGKGGYACGDYEFINVDY